MNGTGKRAWVLAEWLTALALLAVIAMLTLPNYLEAKTRSDVSQVLADLRRLETALTAYKLDNGRWMPDHYYCHLYIDPPVYTKAINDSFIWGHLTTPVAYMHELLTDPFYFTISRDAPLFPYYWYYGPGWLREVNKVGESFSAEYFLAQWLIGSPGPDKSWGFGEWVMYIPEIEANGGGSPRMYDPSNGIVSHGDIVRCENMEQGLKRLQ